MLQRFHILLAQVQAGNTSENLLDEIQQIVYSLYQAKQISRKYVIIYWNQYRNEHDIHSESSKASDLCRLVINLTDKMDFQKDEKFVSLSDLSIYYTWKNIKSYQNNKFEI